MAPPRPLSVVQQQGQQQVQQVQEASPIADLLAFRGRVPTFSDALVILEACRQGSLTMVNRRLTDLERREIACGDVFVFDEAVSGIKRWADGRLWSSSRMRDCFLIYIELGMAAGISGFNPRRVPASSPSELLRKKVLSITTSTGQRLRLVAYSSAMDDDSDEPAPEANITGITPRRDPRLANIVIPAGIFHSNTGPMGGARGDAEQQPLQQPRIASAAESSTSGSSSSAAGTGRSRGGRPSAAATAAVRQSSSAATTGSDAHHLHHTRSSVSFGGGHNYAYDSAYYGGASHYNPSSSGSPPSSIVSAPAPDRASSNAGSVLRRRPDQHSQSADATTTSPAGSGSEVAGYRVGTQAQPYAAGGGAYGGAYGGASTGYLPNHYPPQHTYHPHPYYGTAAAHAHQYAPVQLQAGFYDAPQHAFDPYRQQQPHPPPQRANADAAAPVPATSTTPASRHADPPVSLSAAAPPPAPTTSPYGTDAAPYLAYPPGHAHHYHGRYTGGGRPRFHPHHHHPAAYYGVPPQSHAPPQSAPAPDLAAVINGSSGAPLTHPPTAAPSAGPRTSPPNTADISARNLDFGRVHRADSGTYLTEAMAHAGAYLARDHRDRPGTWAAAPYYAHVGDVGAVGAPGVGRDGLARAMGLAVSAAAPAAGGSLSNSAVAADVGETNGRSPRGAAAAGEVAVRAGVV